MQPASDTSPDSPNRVAPEVFVDTCILLNFVQSEFEGDRTWALLEAERPRITTGVTVEEEFRTVTDRRIDIYEDFLDFLLDEEGELSEYDDTDGRAYLNANDQRHVRNLQMKLSASGSRQAVLRDLRHMLRAVGRRVEHVQTEILSSNVFPDQPGFDLQLAMGRVVDNDQDVKVLGDAALWAAEGGSGSNIFVTMDKDDILDAMAAINDVLAEKRSDAWQLTITSPEGIEVEERSPAER